MGLGAPHVDDQKLRWANSPSQFKDLQGMQVHWRDEGLQDDPDPILLIYGTFSNLHTWDGWVQVLKAGCRLVRMDLSGFGLQGSAPDVDYTTKYSANFILQQIDP